MNDTSPTKDRNSGPASQVFRPRVLLFLGVLCAVSFYFAPRSFRGLSSSDALSVQKKFLDLGDVWENPAIQWSLPLANTTSQDLHIDSFVSSCACVSTDSMPLTVPSNGSQEVRLSLKLFFARSESDLDQKDLAIRISPLLLEAVPQQPVWILRGRLRRLLRLTPRELFLPVTSGQPVTGNRIVVRTSLGLDELRASCEGRWGDVTVQRDADAPDRFDVTIKPRTDLPPGRFRFPVILQPSKGSENLPSTTVYVEGVVVGDIEADPDVLLFGPRQIGESVSETVILRAKSKKSFEIQGVKHPNDVKVEPVSDRAFAFRIWLHISQAGRQEATIVFSVRNQDGAVSSVNQKCVYVGLPQPRVFCVKETGHEPKP